MPNIKEILKVAKEAGASDVHMTVGISPKMRVNGELHVMDYPKLYPADTLEVVLSIMTEAQRDAFEAEGEYDMSFSIPDMGRYRLNAYKQRGSIALAFRLVGTHIPTLEELGIPESVIELYQKKRGLVLVAGPAGCGKSTTLAAMVNHINNLRDAHIITLENPIEFLHKHKMSIVNQREIGLDSQSYKHALRAALREDPDVLLVGEMLDMETIDSAITAVEMGHLVLSSIHTIGAVGTLERMIELFPEHRQQQTRERLSRVVDTIVFQQLLPKANGKGSVAAFEVLHANRAIRSLLQEGKMDQIESVMQKNHPNGLITMDDFIQKLYEGGEISRDIAILSAQNQESMSKKI